MVRIYSPSRDELQSQFANQFKDIIRKQKQIKALWLIVRDFSIMLFVFAILCLVVFLPALV